LDFKNGFVVCFSGRVWNSVFRQTFNSWNLCNQTYALLSRDNLFLHISQFYLLIDEGAALDADALAELLVRAGNATLFNIVEEGCLCCL
jgi:hypothetical protein